MQNDYKGEKIMSQKVQRKYTLNIQGVVEIDDQRITIAIEDKGEYDLAELMKAFDGNECKIAVSYDEEYAPEVDTETGEVI